MGHGHDSDATPQATNVRPAEDAASLMRDAIKAFVEESPENRLRFIDDSPMFDEPLVAFADGDDPLFTQYKEIIGDFHLTPREVLGPEVPESGDTETVSVISWILPIARKTRLSNRRRELTPSVRWSHTRTYGEQFNDLLRKHVVSVLTDMGHAAVAPLLASAYRTVEREDGPASNWSERHAAYAAGLGTFSLSDGFITPVGMAMRCGSVVTNLQLAAAAVRRPGHLSSCPYYVDGSCGICIDRCPAAAITKNGHDKRKCQAYYRSRDMEVLAERYGAAIAGCGLCQTGVPCESRDPTSLRSR